jgi:hypothetical protein
MKMLFDAKPEKRPSGLFSLLQKVLTASVFIYGVYLAVLLFLYSRLADGFADAVAQFGVSRALAHGLVFLAMPWGAHFLSKLIRPAWAGGWRHSNAAAAVLVALYFSTTTLVVPNFQGGAPTRWVALTPMGLSECSGPGYEPKFNVPCQQFTAALAVVVNRFNHGGCFEVDPAASSWFSPITGAPQIYFTQRNGLLKFNGCPIYDPETREQYQPVTAAVRAEYEKNKK